MARTDVVVINGTEYAYDEGVRCGRQHVTSYMKYANFKALDLNTIGNAFTVYIMDWNDLTADQQAEVGGQLVMFDADTKGWLKQ